VRDVEIEPAPLSPIALKLEIQRFYVEKCNMPTHQVRFIRLVWCVLVPDTFGFHRLNSRIPVDHDFVSKKGLECWIDRGIGPRQRGYRSSPAEGVAKVGLNAIYGLLEPHHL